MTAAATTMSPTVKANPGEKKLVVAIMGLSRGRSLADTFAKHSDCVIKYVCDVDKNRAERAAEELEGKVGYRPQAITTWETFIEDDEVDIVACAAPNHWHAPTTIVAAEAGKHVYVEKPCCQNPWEGEMQIAAARKNKVCVQIGTQRRSAPTYREGVEFIHGGGIGKVHSARCVYFSARASIGSGKPAQVPEYLDYERWQGPIPRREYIDNLVHYNWHWRWFYGNGELGNNGIHSLDIARWALQVEFPTTVSSTGGRYYFDDDQETPDTHVVSFEFENVHFTYPGTSTKVLAGISFKVEAGRFLGVMGHTGAGKTTILKLLMRYYEPQEGRVLVNGIDVQDLTLDSVRAAMGFVSQEPFLFFGTLKQNVSYNREADDDEVMKALEMAGAAEFVRDFEDGLETMVGDRGTKLSGEILIKKSAFFNTSLIGSSCKISILEFSLLIVDFIILL